MFKQALWDWPELFWRRSYEIKNGPLDHIRLAFSNAGIALQFGCLSGDSMAFL